MNDVDESTAPLIPIENIPLRPARQSHDGERVFLEKWQRFAARMDPEEFEEIFRHTLFCWNQRAASVAASFALWLGTNCGSSIIRAAEARKREGENAERAYLIAWTLENERFRWLNYGARTVEAVLASQDLVLDSGFGARLHVDRLPTVTLHDLDVIECLLRWLASPQGQAYIAAAEAELALLRKNRNLFGEVTS